MYCYTVFNISIIILTSEFIYVQKPLSISQLKRNPFKKTPTSSGNVVSSTFKHLTETAIGFDSQETQDIDFDSVSAIAQDTEKENLNTENNTPKASVRLFFFNFQTKNI